MAIGTTIGLELVDGSTLIGTFRGRRRTSDSAAADPASIEILLDVPAGIRSVRASDASRFVVYDRASMGPPSRAPKLVMLGILAIGAGAVIASQAGAF